LNPSFDNSSSVNLIQTSPVGSIIFFLLKGLTSSAF
jgi:hypothetical protein